MRYSGGTEQGAEGPERGLAGEHRGGTGRRGSRGPRQANPSVGAPTEGFASGPPRGEGLGISLTENMQLFPLSFFLFSLWDPESGFLLAWKFPSLSGAVLGEKNSFRGLFSGSGPSGFCLGDPLSLSAGLAGVSVSFHSVKERCHTSY